MGLFNFVKEAGEKLWDNLTDHKGQSDKITEHLKKLNIPVPIRFRLTSPTAKPA